MGLHAIIYNSQYVRSNAESETERNIKISFPTSFCLLFFLQRPKLKTDLEIEIPLN